MIARTGWPAGLLQDDCRRLARWFSEKPDARAHARDVAEEARKHREWVDLQRAKIKACNEHDARRAREGWGL